MNLEMWSVIVIGRDEEGLNEEDKKLEEDDGRRKEK